MKSTRYALPRNTKDAADKASCVQHMKALIATQISGSTRRITAVYQGAARPAEIAYMANSCAAFGFADIEARAKALNGGKSLYAINPTITGTIPGLPHWPLGIANNGGGSGNQKHGKGTGPGTVGIAAGVTAKALAQTLALIKLGRGNSSLSLPSAGPLQSTNPTRPIQTILI